MHVGIIGATTPMPLPLVAAFAVFFFFLYSRNEWSRIVLVSNRNESNRIGFETKRDGIQKQIVTINAIRTIREEWMHAFILLLFAFWKMFCATLILPMPKTKIFDDYARIIGYCLKMYSFLGRENFSLTFVVYHENIATYLIKSGIWEWFRRTEIKQNWTELNRNRTQN